MTRAEVIASLKILKVAYPAFYSRMTRSSAEDTIAVWCEMFRDEDVDVMKLALYKIIEEHTNFPPTIADIKTKIKEMRIAATGEKTDEELWQTLKSAVSDGYYGYKEQYAKLPEEVKRYLGSPSTLRELSQLDTGTFNTVTHGQFLKQIGIIRDRVRFDLETPTEIKNLLASMAHKLPENAQLTADGFNASRNSVLDQLEAPERRAEYGE